MAKLGNSGWVRVQMVCRIEEYDSVVVPRCRAEGLSESSTVRKMFGLPISERDVSRTPPATVPKRRATKATAGSSSAPPKLKKKQSASVKVGEPVKEVIASATEINMLVVEPSEATEVAGAPVVATEVVPVVSLSPGSLPESMFDSNIDYEWVEGDDEKEPEAVTESPNPEGETILDLQH